MSSTSLTTSTPSVTQSSSANVNGFNTALIVGVVVGGSIALVIAIVIIFSVLRRQSFRRSRVQFRRQNTLNHAHVRLASSSSVGDNKYQLSAPLLNDQKHEKPNDNVRRYALYDPQPRGSPYDNNESMEGQELAVTSHPYLPSPHSPHSSASNVNLSQLAPPQATESHALVSPRSSHTPVSNPNLTPLVIPQFKSVTVAVMEELDVLEKASPTNDGVASDHISISSAVEASPASASNYSQGSDVTERFTTPPPVPLIPSHLKSTVTDNSAITRGNTRVIGMMLKQRAKRYTPDATPEPPSPVSPIERSGSIKPTSSPIESEEGKPSSMSAQQRKKALLPMDTLMEVPDSAASNNTAVPNSTASPFPVEVPGSAASNNTAVSNSTASPFPVISWQFPAPPGPPAPAVLATTLLPAHTPAPSDWDSAQLYANVSPLKISKPPRDRDQPGTRRGVQLREGSVEKALDPSYSKTPSRFQSTYGEIKYHSSLTAGH